jgi:hypothetical protein
MTPSIGVLKFSSSFMSSKPMRNQNLSSSSLAWTSSIVVMGLGRWRPKFVGTSEKNCDERSESTLPLEPRFASMEASTSMPFSICEADSLPRAWSALPSSSPPSSVSTS